MNDYLENSINYPDWKKGIYPIREDAVNGIKEGTLYVAIINDEIVGSIILSHKPEPAYSDVIWQRELRYSNVFVIYTFVVHPKYFNQGIGEALIKIVSHKGVIKNDFNYFSNNIFLFSIYCFFILRL
ncbi:MAG: GNAT family N-acetyltransferase [Terrisporobacter sp.]